MRPTFTYNLAQRYSAEVHTEDSLFSAMALPALLQCSGQIGSGPSWAEVRGNLPQTRKFRAKKSYQ